MSGVTIIPQKMLHTLNTSLKSISWIDSNPISWRLTCVAIRMTGARLRLASWRPLMKCRLAGVAASGTGREAAGEQRFTLCRKGSGFFVPHVDPIDLAAVDNMGDPVQRVANNSVASSLAGGLQNLDQYISHAFTHSRNSCF